MLDESSFQPFTLVDYNGDLYNLETEADFHMVLKNLTDRDNKKFRDGITKLYKELERKYLWDNEKLTVLRRGISDANKTDA